MSSIRVFFPMKKSPIKADFHLDVSCGKSSREKFFRAKIASVDFSLVFWFYCFCENVGRIVEACKKTYGQSEKNMAALNKTQVLLLLLLRRRKNQRKCRKRFWMRKIYEERKSRVEFHCLQQEMKLFDHELF